MSLRIHRLALAGLLAVAALGLTQCRLVDDRITGVDLRTSAPASAGSDCARACSEDFKECKRAEDASHRSALKACERLGTDDERKACKKAELERHQQAHLACVAAKSRCKDACYDEGGGTGGS